MPIVITCSCGKRLKVADDSAGKKVRCPVCGEVKLVPEADFVKPLDEDADPPASPSAPQKKTGRRVHRDDGNWEVGDEVLAPMMPDCLNFGIIRELQASKALVEFPQCDYTGWVFARALMNVAVRPDLEVKCFEKGGGIRDGKVVSVHGDNVRVVLGYNYGPDQPIQWTEEQAQFDVSAIGIPCAPTSPGAKSAAEFEFYENLHAGDRVWAPWERNNLYPGNVAEVKGHEVHVYFDNGNRGWVLMGQTSPFAPYVGEYVSVYKGGNGTITASQGKRLQVQYENGGKQAWVAPAKLMKRHVLPTGPNARPTKFAGGLLVKLICIPLGLLLTLLAAGVLVLFEDYAAKQAQTIAEGASSCISISPDRVDPANEGKLVHLTGLATTDETLSDEVFKFAVSAKALKLVRTVEIFQWVERHETKKETQGGKEVKVTHYYHDGKWVSDPVSSIGFHENAKTGKKPINVVGPKPPNEVVRAKDVKLGAFRLTQEQVDRIGKGDKLPVPEQVVANPPEELKKKIKILDGAVYVCMYPDTDPTNPNVGDVRITFTELKPQPVAVVAKQTKDSFEPWVSSTGTNTFNEIRPGTMTMAEIFEKAEQTNQLVILIMRVLCGTVLVVGMYLLVVHWWLWRKVFGKTKIAG